MPTALLLIASLLFHGSAPHQGQPVEVQNYLEARQLIQSFQKDAQGIEDNAVTAYAGKRFVAGGVDHVMTANDIRSNFVVRVKSGLTILLKNIDDAKAQYDQHKITGQSLCWIVYDSVRSADDWSWRAAGRFAGTDGLGYLPFDVTSDGFIGVMEGASRTHYDDVGTYWNQLNANRSQISADELPAFDAKNRDAEVKAETAYFEGVAPAFRSMRDWLKQRRTEVISSLYHWQDVADSTIPDEEANSFANHVATSYNNIENTRKSGFDPGHSMVSLEEDGGGYGVDFSTYQWAIAFSNGGPLATSWADVRAQGNIGNSDPITFTLAGAIADPASSYRGGHSRSRDPKNPKTKAKDPTPPPAPGKGGTPPGGVPGTTGGNPNPGKPKNRPKPVSLSIGQPDFSDRLKASQMALRDVAVDLGKQKASLEDTVEQDDKTVRAGGDRITALGTQQDSLVSAADKLRNDLAKLRSEEVKVADVSSLLDQEDKTEADLASLLAEHQPSKADLRKIKSLQSQLDSIDAVIRERLAGSPVGALRDQIVARLKTLDTQTEQVRNSGLDLREKGLDLMSDMEADRAKVRPIDEQLMILAGRLATLEPAIAEVQASVGTDTVFDASAARPTVDLSKIDADIQLQKQTIEKMRATNVDAKQAYFGAAKDTVASGNRLVATLNTLMVARGAVDGLFHTIDLLEAFEKGGFVGLGVEAAKKIIEQNMMPKPPDGIVPGSPEDKINQLYSAELKNAFSPDAIKFAAVSRLLKETDIKKLKDGINQFEGAWVFDKVEYPIRFRLQVEPHLIQGTADSYEKAEKALETLTNQGKKLRQGYAYSPDNVLPNKMNALKGVAKTLSKDLLKTVIKGSLDQIETAAWDDYYEAALIEKAMYPAYHVGVGQREEAEEFLDGLFIQRAQLQQGLPPQGIFKTSVSDSFDPSLSVIIHLVLTSKTKPVIPFRVFVGGVEARPGPLQNEFTADVHRSLAGPDGKLPITIR